MYCSEFGDDSDLSTYKEAKHPDHRPPYTHIVPLAEVLSLVTGVSTLTSKRISERWNALVSALDSEINVLVDSDISEIKKIDYEAGKVIERFRSGRMHYVGGGGGQYGKPALKDSGDDFFGCGQQSLPDF